MFYGKSAPTYYFLETPGNDSTINAAINSSWRLGLGTREDSFGLSGHCQSG